MTTRPHFENLRKSSENGRKSSENRQNNTLLLGDMKFLFSCSIRVELSKMNFISPCNHVLSSIYY